MNEVYIPGLPPIERITAIALSILRRAADKPVAISAVATVVRKRLTQLGLVMILPTQADDPPGARARFGHLVITPLGHKYLEHIETPPLSERALAMLARIEREGSVSTSVMPGALLHRLRRGGYLLQPTGPERRVTLSAHGRARLRRHLNDVVVAEAPRAEQARGEDAR